MERLKSNVGKGFGWRNPINKMDRDACMTDVKSDLGKGFGCGNTTNYMDVGCLWTKKN